jgi:hypothetical protein
MADGGIVVPLGTAQFPVQLSNKTIYYDLVIADVDAPMIIGFDFLSSNKCILKMGDGTLKIHGEEILCNFENLNKDYQNICYLFLYMNHTVQYHIL